MRKPAYHVFQLLALLGVERVTTAAEGADSFCNAIVTVPPESSRRAHVLVYAYDHTDEPVTRAVDVAVDLPRGARPGALYRVDSTENNVVARWRELGAPAYLSREQTRELRADNQLSASPANAVRIEQMEGRVAARFVMESPGVALLEVEMAAENNG